MLEQYDPHREFLPSSPFGGDTFASATKGTCHVTAFLRDIFNYIESGDFSNYTNYLTGFLSRFCSEYPIFGFPFLSSLKKFLTEEDIFGESDDMLKFHSKGNPSMKTGLYDYYKLMAEKIFGDFKNAEDIIFKQQYLQCELLRIAFEAHRRNKWFSSGILFWMLNDCWPSSSGWSLIDYYAMPKPAYYTFKRCAKPVIASIERSNGCYKVYVCNDTLKRINRGHTFEVAEEAIRKTAARGIRVGAHIILGLPGETNDQLIKQAGVLSALPLTTLKLHQLQLIKGTRMAHEFEMQPEDFHLYSADEYIDLVIDYVEHLRPDIVLERFVSQSPKELLIAPDWGLKNHEFTDKVKKRMRERDAWQGKKYAIKKEE
mgnify:CR=1 FL=1